MIGLLNRKYLKTYSCLAWLLVWCCFAGNVTLAQQTSMVAATTANQKESKESVDVANGSTPDAQSEDKKEKKKNKKKKDKKKLKWDGNVKFAFRFAKSRARRAEDHGGFEFSAINLKAKYRLQKGLELRGWYQIDPIESMLKEAYARLEDKDATFDLIQMGFQRRLFYLKSDLETDSLNKIALYRLRDLSVLARISFLKRWYWDIQLANGGQLDTRDISPRRVTKQDVILSDSFDDRQATGTNSREILSGLGYKLKNVSSQFKKLYFLLFASLRPVSDNDAQDLATLSDVPGFTGVSVGNTTYTKMGLNVTWEYGQVESYSQYARVKVRELERDLLSTEWSYRYKKWTPIFAYSQQTLSVDPDFTARLSWDRRRFTLGLRYQWLDAARLAVEVTANDEDTGGKSINNDELLVSWVYSF